MSYADLFPDFQDEARCWIYAADRPLTEAEQAEIFRACNHFFEGWTSHRRGVKGAVHILFNRFLLLVAHVPDGDISGCGIDKSVHVLEKAAQQADFDWLSPLHIFFRDADGQVQHLPRPAFRKNVRAGNVTAETPVFDLGVATLGTVRHDGFEQPAGESWHARVFRIPHPTP